MGNASAMIITEKFGKESLKMFYSCLLKHNSSDGVPSDSSKCERGSWKNILLEKHLTELGPETIKDLIHTIFGEFMRYIAR